jgi:hypothetical protein
VLRRVLVTQLPLEDIHQAVTVLCDAFRDYPVMRYVLGTADDYERRLHTLIGFFVSARVFREEPVLGIYDRDGTLAATALVTLPGERPVPEALSSGVNRCGRSSDRPSGSVTKRSEPLAHNSGRKRPTTT